MSPRSQIIPKFFKGGWGYNELVILLYISGLRVSLFAVAFFLTIFSLSLREF